MLRDLRDLAFDVSFLLIRWHLRFYTSTGSGRLPCKI